MRRTCNNFVVAWLHTCGQQCSFRRASAFTYRLSTWTCQYSTKTQHSVLSSCFLASRTGRMLRPFLTARDSSFGLCWLLVFNRLLLLLKTKTSHPGGMWFFSLGLCVATSKVSRVPWPVLILVLGSRADWCGFHGLCLLMWLIPLRMPSHIYTTDDCYAHHAPLMGQTCTVRRTCSQSRTKSH